MKGKIQRFLIDEQTARMHEAVSDSVYVVGAKAAERAVGEIPVGEQPSGTLTDMVNNITKARKISLLHLSDNHGWLGGLRKMAALLAEGNDAFGINTGDITSYSSINGYAAVLKVMSDWNAQCNGHPILLLKGNHDTWDTNIGNNEKQCTHTLLKPVDAGFVKWGEATGGEWNDNIVGGYWHKDVVENGVKLRVIALDEYQHSVGDPRRDSLYYYTKVYSQAQVDWLVNLLKSTPSDAYIVLCHHQPLYTTHPSTVMNDFVHHGIVGAQMDSNTSHVFSYKMYTYKPENVDMAARIVDAYLHKKHLVLTSYPSGVDGVTLNIDADFRGIEPAKFACHLCGHVHGDYCEHHPDFHEQICLTVGTDSPSISSWYEDLVRSQTTGNVASYVINRVTIDADRDVVRVDRIGAHELNVNKKYNGVTLINNDGSSRKWIEFAIPNTNEKCTANSGLQVARPTITADWSYEDYGDPASRSALEGRLDNYYPEWRSESAMVALVDAYVAGNDVLGLTLTRTGFNAINTVFVDMDTEGNDIMESANAVTNNPALSADNYVDYGQTDAVAPVLPGNFTAADEFVFSFTCLSDNCELTLPKGVAWADGFDFEADRKAGAKVQVSIQDGMAGYLMVSPTT